jgi:hypothetical protein
MKYLAFLVGFFFASLVSSAHGASGALLMEDGASLVVVSEREEELQLWQPGHTEPTWILPIRGLGAGARSRIAAMALLPSNQILVVERYGRILLISRDGKLLARKTPIYEYVLFGVDLPEVDWSNWGKQVRDIGHTAAAYITADGKYVYLVPDEWAVLRRVPVEEFLRSPSQMVQVARTFAYHFQGKTSVAIVKRTDSPPPFEVRYWNMGEHASDATALAACEGWVIAGTEHGLVTFNPENGDSEKERRVRQLGDSDRGVKSVLDIGCLRNGLAYSVSFDAGNGQLQLWDLSTRAALHTVGYLSDGHPGMAFAAVAGKSGTHLLSLGEGDIRLWSIENRRLKLIAEHAGNFAAQHQAFAATALTSGDFLYWDGKGVWRIPVDGSDPVLYAGRRTRTLRRQRD